MRPQRQGKPRVGSERTLPGAQELGAIHAFANTFSRGSVGHCCGVSAARETLHRGRGDQSRTGDSASRQARTRWRYERGVAVRYAHRSRVRTLVCLSGAEASRLFGSARRCAEGLPTLPGRGRAAGRDDGLTCKIPCSTRRQCPTRSNLPSIGRVPVRVSRLSLPPRRGATLRAHRGGCACHDPRSEGPSPRPGP